MEKVTLEGKSRCAACVNYLDTCCISAKHAGQLQLWKAGKLKSAPKATSCEPCRLKKRRCEFPDAPEKNQRKRKGEEAPSEDSSRVPKRGKGQSPTIEATGSRGQKRNKGKATVIPAGEKDVIAGEIDKMDQSLGLVQIAVEQTQQQLTILDTHSGHTKKELAEMKTQLADLEKRVVRFEKKQTDVQHTVELVAFEQLKQSELLMLMAGKLDIDRNSIANIWMGDEGNQSGKKGKGKASGRGDNSNVGRMEVDS